MKCDKLTIPADTRLIRRPFNPGSAAVQEYDDQAYQNVYYVAESFEDAKAKFRAWVGHTSLSRVACHESRVPRVQVRHELSRQFTVRYDPFTHSVQVVDTYGDTSCMIEVRTGDNYHSV